MRSARTRGQGRSRPTRNSISSCCSIGSASPARKSGRGAIRARAPSSAGSGAGDRQRDGGAAIFAQMGNAAPSRTAVERHPGGRTRPTPPPKPRRSLWRCARRLRRRARPPRWLRLIGSSPQRVSVCSRGGESKPTTAPERRLSQTAPGTLAARNRVGRGRGTGPVPLLALAKHPLVGGEGDERLAWLDDGPGDRPQAARAAAAGRARGARAFRCSKAARWQQARERTVAAIDGAADRAARRSTASPKRLAEVAQALAGDAAWRGPAGGWPPSCWASCRPPRRRRR